MENKNKKSSEEMKHKFNWHIGVKTAICRDLPAQVNRVRYIRDKQVYVVWQCHALGKCVERNCEMTIEQAVALCEMDAVREIAKLYKKVSEFYGEIKC